MGGGLRIDGDSNFQPQKNSKRAPNSERGRSNPGRQSQIPRRRKRSRELLSQRRGETRNCKKHSGTGAKLQGLAKTHDGNQLLAARGQKEPGSGMM